MIILNGQYFITATDTDAGKTFVSCALLKAAGDAGLTSLGLKPVASGAVNNKNDDALKLAAASSITIPYKQTNPYCFSSPIAPHIAAMQEGVSFSAADIANACRIEAAEQASLCLIEGAGGWRVPLNMHENWSDLVRLLEIPVILVVGMKLGCINHALLTEQIMLADGVKVHGWIANQLSGNQAAFDENLLYLTKNLVSRRLAVVAYQPDSEL